MNAEPNDPSPGPGPGAGAAPGGSGSATGPGISAAGSDRPAPPLRLGEWLLTLRWAAFAGLAAVALHATVIAPRVGQASAAALWTGVALLGVVNLGLSLGGAARASTERFVVAQIVFDVALITSLLHTAGGTANPFAPLYAFHAVLAALLLGAPKSRQVILGIGGAVALLTVVETLWVEPGCVHDGLGTCRVVDPTSLLGSGVAILLLTLLCGLVVEALMTQTRAERVRLETVMDCIADAVLFAAPDGRIVMKNRAAAELWPDRTIPAEDLRVCHTPSRWQEMLSKLRNPGAHEHHPVIPIGDRFFEATYGRVCRKGGTSFGAVMVARDVTERLRAQEMAAHRERMATIGKLAAALAHEINNPLGTIQLYSQHLLKRATGDGAEHLGTILRNADVCKRIVRDLLEYARQRPPDKRVVPAAALIDRAARTLAPHADRQRVVLDLGPPAAGEELTVMADADQVIQVLVNLGMNAIEAMNDGGTLRFLLGQRGPEVTITVSDTGPGIPAAQTEQVFSPFFTTKAEGTGLGLAVASDIASAHGGRLELVSPGGTGQPSGPSASGEETSGATFTLTLPRAGAEAA